MLISLHKNAVSTPSVRAQMQQFSGSEYGSAERYGISRTSVQQRSYRASVEDRSHASYLPQTSLNADQEGLVVYLNQQLCLPLYELLAGVRASLYPTRGRSSLHRLLVRRSVVQLPMPSRRHAFVAIDRARRWVFVAINRRETAAAARNFLNEAGEAAPFENPGLETCLI